ncbi:MipA/OmpV family protein [Hydrogenophaga sp. PBL-H3]|uniref:MipA/OmpV family protein n=1 Tax=Hydrogenophaga sp. PBL-H3 TaxID=434010 RepID=UPI0013203534|nr:MipA/OmpV family protein [Hydrogenophaga sp. PBL-H3]QHE77963.1 MipA/OmpV family protein [Hydrogenophaga sp. PBL-H3]QHE82387.1 MipA/OmpV family protein [Hydrogenophaga sp. PBL-H3]
MRGSRVGIQAVATLAWALSGAAGAAEPVALEASRDYLLGASLSSGRDPFGTSDQRLSLRPIWAFQLGRFRFATSGASALLAQGRESVDSGVSTVLTRSDLVSLSTSLAIDEGRSWRGDPVYDGLPRVRDTLRGRFTAGVTLSPRWSASLRASQDLLGRGGGLRLDSGLNYRHPISPQTHWDLSIGTGWANRTFRQTHYGIAPAAAAATGLQAHDLGAGFDTVSLGWRITSALNKRWVAYGGLNVSQLQGAVARSPLATRTTTLGASVGLAYRND